MQQTSTGGVCVHLDRFCTRCGRYEVRVDVPAPPESGDDRATWMKAQKRKALALRGTPTVEAWVCSRCGCEECHAAASAAAVASPPAR